MNPAGLVLAGLGLAIGAWCHWRRLAAPAALIGGTVAYLAGFALLVALQYPAARSAAPFADALMLRLDQAIGDWPAFYRFALDRPWLWQALAWIYGRTFAALWLVLVALAFLDRRRLWRLVLANLVAGLLVMALFALFPTIGPEASLGVGAGHARSVALLLDLRAHAGEITTTGLVFFPSYHSVGLALLVYGARGLPPAARLPLYCFGMIGLVSVIPIGGHYFVDAIAGVAIAGVAIRCARGRSRISPAIAKARAIV